MPGLASPCFAVFSTGGKQARMMATSPAASEPIPGRLSLWDAISIIVGIIIGVGIYATPAHVFRNVSGPGEALGAWLLGGLLSLVGALCFAELASTYPRSG